VTISRNFQISFDEGASLFARSFHRGDFKGRFKEQTYLGGYVFQFKDLQIAPNAKPIPVATVIYNQPNLSDRNSQDPCAWVIEEPSGQTHFVPLLPP
jgi:hypothetical protein